MLSDEERGSTAGMRFRAFHEMMLVCTALVVLAGCVLYYAHWRPLPPASDEQVTAVLTVQGHTEKAWRTAVLNLCNSGDIAHVVLVWANARWQPPSPSLFARGHCASPVTVWNPPSESPLSKFQIAGLIHTGGVLFVDADVMVSDWDIGRLVTAWRRQPATIHGFERQLVHCERRRQQQLSADAASSDAVQWRCDYQSDPAASAARYNAAMGGSLLMHRLLVEAFAKDEAMRELLLDSGEADYASAGEAGAVAPPGPEPADVDLAVQFAMAAATRKPVHVIRPQMLYHHSDRRGSGGGGGDDDDEDDFDFREAQYVDDQRHARFAERLCRHFDAMPLEETTIGRTDGLTDAVIAWSPLGLLRHFQQAWVWSNRMRPLAADAIGTLPIAVVA